MLRRIQIFLLLSLLCSSVTCAQIPNTEGERTRYNVQIDFKNAYISGICGMLFEDGLLKASIINEFGLTAMDFEYDPQKDKVKIVFVVKKLDHWYIKRLLRRDLRELLHNMTKGGNKYEDKKYDITYTFTPMCSTITGRE